jgi:alpha-L-fucosidase
MDKVKAYLKTVDAVVAKGPFRPEWESLATHTLPQWYRNAKFGIFIHWGAYSVPAFANEWYPRNMYVAGTPEFEHHVKTYGPQKTFGYKDFIPQFRGEKFDAAEWAELFRRAGARFVMPVAEHHDGFPMYDCGFTEWSAAKMGPRRDVVGELARELEARGLVLTVSSHRVEHYWFLAGAREFDSDIVGEVPYGHLYWPTKKQPFPEGGQEGIEAGPVDQDFLDDWLARTCELVDKYKPRIVYFDWWIQILPMKPYLKRFAAYYFNRAAEWGLEVTINYKHDAFLHGTAVRDIERGQLAGISPDFWQNDTAVAKNSWCYTEGNEYKTPADILADLVDVVAKNGSLLLNVGPRSDGTIPAEDRAILEAVGDWLALNGEGVYDTRNWRTHGEGPTVSPEGSFTDTQRQAYTSADFRFTFKGTNLYVFALKWPADGVVTIKSLGKKSHGFRAPIRSVAVLGSQGPVKFTLEDEFLRVEARMPAVTGPVCLRVELD